MQGRKFIAFLAAVLAASTFAMATAILMLAIYESEGGNFAWPKFTERDVDLLLTAIFIVFLLTLPIWLIGDTYAKWRNITHVGWFVKTGAAIAAAIVILPSLGTIGSSYTGGIGQVGGMALIAMLGAISGGLGGYVYWALALRQADQA